MKKPKITIRNLQHAAFASHETHCFEATVYVDGRRFMAAYNGGYGGPTQFDPIPNVSTREDITELEKRVAATFPKWGTEVGLDADIYETDLEIVVFDLVNAALTKRRRAA